MEKMYRIVPTVWLRNDEDFYELAKVFGEFGIKEIRVNCTRHEISDYVREITKFKSWCNTNLGFEFQIMLDLPIPNRKVRIFHRSDGQVKKIQKGEKFMVYDQKYSGKMDMVNSLYVSGFNTLYKLNEGERFWIGDTGLEFVVINKMFNSILVQNVRAGDIDYGKYIIADRFKYQRNSVEQIEPYIKMCNTLCLEMVAFSFINDEEDIENITYQNIWKCASKVIAKIETREGYCNLAKISKKCDMIMVARGDLLNNTGHKYFAKYVVDIMGWCEKNCVNYYVATGILETFRGSQEVVKRAELIDIYSILKNKFSKVILTYGICRDVETAKRTLSLIRDIEM